MTDISNDTFSELCAAIILQATKDYTNAIVDNDIRTINECESFFRSEWFMQISTLKVDGEVIQKKLKKGATEFANMANDTIKRGFTSYKHEPQYSAFKCPICGGYVYSKIIERRIYKKTEYHNFVSCATCDVKLERPVKTNDETVKC